MTKVDGYEKKLAVLDDLIEEITVDAYGDQEQLWAFLQSFEDEVTLPCDGFVIGEPVSVVEIDYDGNERRGLTARCRRRDGSEHVVAASDLLAPEGSSAALYLACYRRWLGIDPFPPVQAPALSEPRHKRKEAEIDPGDSVDLAVLSVKEKAVRCRHMGGDLVTLRPSLLRDLAPGEIVTVRARKSWSFKGHPYLSGDIESVRVDAAALGLDPLRLMESGIWTPEQEYWGEEGEPVEDWAKPIIARGARPSFRMEQVLPGVAPDDFDADPISKSNDLKELGESDGALKILMELCQDDLRCLDAHAHLGNFEFDRSPKTALRHYEVGVRIGELSFPPGFDGLLPWGPVDNRPFLRCMNGYGLCLWRLDRFKDAEEIFERMLWLNPSDNQGVRFLIDEVKSGIAWREE